MKFSIVLSILLSLSACTQKPALPNLEKHGRGAGDAENGGTGSGPSDEGKDKETVAPEYPTEINLATSKFKGEESKLSAVIKYAGSTSEKLKLTTSDSKALVTVPKLASGKNDALTIELYEGEKLRFRATRANTAIEKSKATEIEIDDCLIQKLPWDGLANETACGWTISDVKN